VNRRSVASVEFTRDGDRLFASLPYRSGFVPTPVDPAPFDFAPERAPEVTRISVALDAAGLWGPEVDEALGAAEPAVDLWESGDLEPSVEDVGRLSTLTGFPPAYFYLGPVEAMDSWICFGRKVDGRRCHRITPETGRVS
jgi:hypothetical protein